MTCNILANNRNAKENTLKIKEIVSIKLKKNTSATETHVEKIKQTVLNPN